MDAATIKLAESFEALRANHKKIGDAKRQAISAEDARRIAIAKEIQALAEQERLAAVELGKAGEARSLVERIMPADLRAAVDRAESELAPHLASLESAKRRLEVQKRHHATIKAGLVVGDKEVPLDAKLASTPAGASIKYDLEESEKAIKALEEEVKVESGRISKFEDAVKRAKNALEDWFKDWRTKTLKIGEKLVEKS